jgi:hypothetical protein
LFIGCCHHDLSRFFFIWISGWGCQFTEPSLTSYDCTEHYTPLSDGKKRAIVLEH